VKVRFNVKRYFQVLGISLAIVVAVAAAAMGFDFASLRTNQAQETTGETNTAVIERDAEKINVLLMGVDVDGLRTDAIMLAQYDVQKNEVNMLSIPRDTKMYIGNRYQKINAAHAFEKNGQIGGPEATVEAVSRITGVPIHYYVDFSFDAVAHVINELGPITFTIPDLYGDGVGMVYDDPVQSLHINLPPGTYELDGTQAVWLMRYRHGNADANGHFNGYTNGDADRVEMQHEFLKAVVDQKLNASLILKLPAIFKDISSEVKTNLAVSDIVTYSKYLTGFTSTNINTYSLPGEYGDDTENGSIWKVNLEETRTLIQDVFGYDAADITVNNPDDPNATTPPNCVTTSTTTTSSGISTTSAYSSYDDDDDDDDDDYGYYDYDDDDDDDSDY
jgi:LCP family protein required for cell wall assembly